MITDTRHGRPGGTGGSPVQVQAGDSQHVQAQASGLYSQDIKSQLVQASGLYSQEPQPAQAQASGLYSQEEWHKRGKYPPHCEYKSIQAITYRLYDSLPEEIIENMRLHLRNADAVGIDKKQQAELRKQIDKYEDAGYGQCFLRDERIASIVRDNLFHFDGIRYHLLNWCIMPNHVHVLINVLDGWTLSQIMHGWRSYTAKEANKILGRTGQFWMEEYFDRYIRDEKHLLAAMEYITNNPIKAGIVLPPWSTGGSPVQTQASGLCSQDIKSQLVQASGLYSQKSQLVQASGLYSQKSQPAQAGGLCSQENNNSK